MNFQLLTFNPAPFGHGMSLSFHFQLNYKDHLGNNRLSYTLDPETHQIKILEENHYYPFGLKHGNYNAIRKDVKYKEQAASKKEVKQVVPEAVKFKYLYNGKELQDELSLNIYDYGARTYDPAAPRFWQIDPLAEKYSFQSVYVYASNNPVFFVDIMGLGVDSIHLDKYGNVLKNVDDGDDGVYVHQNATSEADVNKSYSKDNTSAGGVKIGKIGGVININEIYSNTLKKDIKEAKNIYNPFTFKKYVKTKGKWDLKNNKNTIYGLANDGKTKFSFKGKLMEAQDIGNHHFGVVALAYGLFPSEKFILKQAGAYQIRSGTSKPEWQVYKKEIRYSYTKLGTPIPYEVKVIQPPYGDDPRDQKWIKAGFQYYKTLNDEN